ncbi:MAG: glycosyltransferase family 4 protein [Nitrospirae bacterium]|nr:glycosyltransferase family 4 protein [Nitrospirota bacterium]
MHIYVIRTYYPHWGKHSGINQFLKYINPNSYDIEVHLASDSDNNFPIKSRLIRKLLRNLVQRQGMRWYKLSDLVAEANAFRGCRRKKVDIIHYLDGEHSAQFLPRLPARLHNSRPKIVATYHQPPQILDSLIIKNILAELDSIIVVSQEQASYLREFVAADKIHLILHGIDVDYFVPADTPKEEGKFRCITVGHYLRDFDAVRNVAERLSSYPDIEFHVVSSKADKVKGLQNINIHSNVDDDKLLKLYQQSDVLFLPLLQSTANNALLEGIACGLPVVSTYLPAVKAYLSGKEAILIKDNNPEQMADAILHLVHNPGDRKNMALAARKRAEELDWRNVAPQYEAVYSKLMSNC